MTEDQIDRLSHLSAEARRLAMDLHEFSAEFGHRDAVVDSAAINAAKAATTLLDAARAANKA